MVIVLQQNISDDDRKKIADFLEEHNFKTNEIIGEEATIIAAVGKLKIDPREVAILQGVERVIPISKPYKMASREFKPENSVIEILSKRGQLIRIGGQRIAAIAGPCAVESREQMMSVARSVYESGAVMLRGGAYKPRTSPYSFQGLGEEGLKLLKEAGDACGMPVVTEVVASEFIPTMERYGIDVYQIGARNMQNFELLKRLGAVGKPVILKRGLSATIEEWLMSAEYLLSSGTENVILCERGIRTYEKATRNTLDLSAIPILRGMTHLPIIVDPSHAIGIRDKVAPMGLAAIASGADGIIVEVHCNPEKALSDGAQSLYPLQFEKLMRDIDALAPVVGKSVSHVRSIKKSNAVEEKSQTHEGIVCAFSGNRGAYAEQAIARFFDADVGTLPVQSFREIFQRVADGSADFGMVPIENTLAGSVYENYDNLTQFEDVSIVGSVMLRIQHSLLAVKGATLDSIKTVYTHPQALHQCQSFLSRHPEWHKIECISTATAASEVAKMHSKENAAIASSVNAAHYNLEVISDAIEDDAANYTRFVIISANHFVDSSDMASAVHAMSGVKPNAASFVFSVKNEPGALYNCLGVFQSFKLNLTRLESRPIAGQPWRYRFYADAELAEQSENAAEYVNSVMTALKVQAEDVRLLGIYGESHKNI
ncbi:MAG: 3-deoxy-7-phosphoheptulonate synthase [Treponema sp.]|nr:3-deoxy-7-phosphoheptulonate synthase [Treponema sp.]